MNPIVLNKKYDEIYSAKEIFSLYHYLHLFQSFANFFYGNIQNIWLSLRDSKPCVML